MSEPLSNVFLVNNRENRAGKYAGQDPETFVGKWVKLAFPVKHPASGNLGTEYMWVSVQTTSTEDLRSKCQLIGVLDNDPMYECPLKCGDLVAFNVEEIDDVLD